MRVLTIAEDYKETKMINKALETFNTSTNPITTSLLIAIYLGLIFALVIGGFYLMDNFKYGGAIYGSLILALVIFCLGYMQAESNQNKE